MQSREGERSRNVLDGWNGLNVKCDEMIMNIQAEYET